MIITILMWLLLFNNDEMFRGKIQYRTAACRLSRIEFCRSRTLELLYVIVNSVFTSLSNLLNSAWNDTDFNLLVVLRLLIHMPCHVAINLSLFIRYVLTILSVSIDCVNNWLNAYSPTDSNPTSNVNAWLSAYPINPTDYFSPTSVKRKRVATSFHLRKRRTLEETHTNQMTPQSFTKLSPHSPENLSSTEASFMKAPLSHSKGSPSKACNTRINSTSSMPNLGLVSILSPVPLGSTDEEDFEELTPRLRRGNRNRSPKKHFELISSLSPTRRGRSLAKFNSILSDY